MSLSVQGMTFDEAHDTVVDAYRYVVLNDYLPQIVGQDAVDAALKKPVKEGFFQPGKDTPFTPVEFSVAAFRFGHSQVRNAYDINDRSGGVKVFRSRFARSERWPSATDELVIDFDNFFSELPREAGDGPALIGRAIDTNISHSLFQLPIPGAEGGGDNVLAFRNLQRAKFYDMPSSSPLRSDGSQPFPAIRRSPKARRCGSDPARSRIDFRRRRTRSGRRRDRGGGVCRPAASRQREAPTDAASLPDISGGDFRIGDLLVAADQLQSVMQ